MTDYTKPSFDELVFAFDEIAKFYDDQIREDNNKTMYLPTQFIISGTQSPNDVFVQEILYKVDNILPGYMREHFRTVNNNILALRNVKPKDYNKAGFDKVISSLQRDGEAHFRMSVFFASLVKRSCEHDPYEMTIPRAEGFSQIFNNTTSEFNCNSVACIAGFAVAEASDWRIKSLYKNIDLGENYVVINLAANYLNIPITVADSVFYTDEHTVWSWLKAQQYYDTTYAESIELSAQVKSHLGKFENINFDQDQFYNCEEHGCEEDIVWENCGVDIDTITWKEAVSLLTLIRDEVIVFNRKFSGKILGSVPYWNPEKMSELQLSK